MGAAALVTGILVVLAAVGGAIAAQRLRARARRPSVPDLARGKVCLFCLTRVSVEGRFATVDEPTARKALGATPPEQSGFTNHKGERHFLTHIDCLRDAQDEVCMFCRQGILPGETIAFLDPPYARAQLGEEPIERSAGVSPQGAPGFFSHADCAHEAVKTVCMFCLKEMEVGDVTIAYETHRARELLGAEPSILSDFTDRKGRECHVAHAECARAAGEGTG
ncbi:hypothetical protein [Actinomadura terrae]|uniref:hypothetical protein n=1 Tax=Actinomadura terrae TaxID=604353 RepID=UPI001FA6B00F|nr:hypothetical protein [Actinomadura terrae]